MTRKTDIGTVDRNLAADDSCAASAVFHTADSPGFELAGLYWRKPGGAFSRLPEEMDCSFNPNLRILARQTSGAALRFRSDSGQVVIRAVVSGTRMVHMTPIGSMGFDLYVGFGNDAVFAGSTKFPVEKDAYTCEVFTVSERKMREFTVYFPLYTEVRQLEIGLAPDAKIQPPEPWSDPRPVVIYGTSITQGGCVSRPGMAYPNILGRLLQRPVYNFGFSGNGRGEPEVAEKLAEIRDPAMYILDYDLNAHPERLERTLKPFIEILRARHPDVPILTVSAPPQAAEAYDPDSPYAGRFRGPFTQIHQQVHAELRAAGDTELYFQDGRGLYGADFAECTVDGIHATDLGSYRFAHALAPLASDILNRKRAPRKQ